MISAVVLAAGSSRRFAESLPDEYGGSTDKLWAEIRPGVPVWRAGYEVLRGVESIGEVGIVCQPGEEYRFEGTGAEFVVAGGVSRHESALRGLAAARGEFALVHDAARPGVSRKLIERVISAMLELGAAAPCVRVRDALKVGDSFIEATIDRSRAWRAQTPQGARRKDLIAAIERFPGAADESEALQSAGVRVAIVESDTSNDKVTTVGDLTALRDRRSALRAATGYGYDIHAFAPTPDRELVIGGVSFPGERGLAGHSDADVLLHAITDALLGAIGAPDIGQLFPNTDAAFSGEDSRVFLREAARRIRAAGGRIGNIDSTVIAETPRIGTRVAEMKAVIAEELGIRESKVGIKATTNEGLGSLGRGEGIAAHAIAAVLLPYGLESED